MKTSTRTKLASALALLEPADYSEAASMFNSQRALLGERAKATFSVGDKVEFTRSKTGEVVKGSIIAINRKNVRVREDNRIMNWSVPPSMLRARR